MNQHVESIAKVASVAILAFFSYMNAHFTPLWPILFAFVFWDLLANAAKPGQQFQKLGAAALSLGLPGYIVSHYNDPTLVKYTVVVIIIIHIQILFPQVFAWIQAHKFSKNPAQNSAAQTSAEELAALVASEVKKVVAVEQAKLKLPTTDAFQTPSTSAIRPAPTANDPSVK